MERGEEREGGRVRGEIGRGRGKERSEEGMREREREDKGGNREGGGMRGIGRSGILSSFSKLHPLPYPQTSIDVCIHIC